MVFKIIRETDPIDIGNITALIYGGDAVGKTSLGLQTRNGCLLDFNNGLHRKHKDVKRKNVVSVRKWSDLNGFFKDEVLKDFETIVIDTGGSAIDCIIADMISKDPKLDNGADGLKSTWQNHAYAKLDQRFNKMIEASRRAGCNVVVMAHSNTYVKDELDHEFIDMQKTIKNRVLRDSDATGRIYLDPTNEDIRYLDFRTTARTNGKDPAGIGRVRLPDPKEQPEFLSDIIDQIINNINAQANAEVTPEVMEEKKQAEEQADAELVAKFTKLVKSAGSDGARKNFIDHMRKNGYDWVEETETFIKI